MISWEFLWDLWWFLIFLSLKIKSNLTNQPHKSTNASVSNKAPKPCLRQRGQNAKLPHPPQGLLDSLPKVFCQVSLLLRLLRNKKANQTNKKMETLHSPANSVGQSTLEKNSKTRKKMEASSEISFQIDIHPEGFD